MAASRARFRNDFPQVSKHRVRVLAMTGVIAEVGVDAKLEQVGPLAKPLKRSASMGDEPRRAHAGILEQIRDLLDDKVGRPVDVECENDFAHSLSATAIPIPSRPNPFPL